MLKHRAIDHLVTQSDDADSACPCRVQNSPGSGDFLFGGPVGSTDDLGLAGVNTCRSGESECGSVPGLVSESALVRNIQVDGIDHADAVRSRSQGHG
jgi:hypothetical protein